MQRPFHGSLGAADGDVAVGATSCLPFGTTMAPSTTFDKLLSRSFLSASDGMSFILSVSVTKQGSTPESPTLEECTPKEHGVCQEPPFESIEIVVSEEELKDGPDARSSYISLASTEWSPSASWPSSAFSDIDASVSRAPTRATSCKELADDENLVVEFTAGGGQNWMRPAPGSPLFSRRPAHDAVYGCLLQGCCGPFVGASERRMVMSL
mmetsp:Transcript_19986/g.64390  ORF Transcript_19986/g.64390 Transcript_19986/m.64390 type:complete len:210 (-) Transcript_19986:271-900(-)